MSTFQEFIHHNQPIWKFWHPESGILGGLVCGAIILAIFIALFYTFQY